MLCVLESRRLSRESSLVRSATRSSSLIILSHWDGRQEKRLRAKQHRTITAGEWRSKLWNHGSLSLVCKLYILLSFISLQLNVYSKCWIHSDVILVWCFCCRRVMVKVKTRWEEMELKRWLFFLRLCEIHSWNFSVCKTDDYFLSWLAEKHITCRGLS